MYRSDPLLSAILCCIFCHLFPSATPLQTPKILTSHSIHCQAHQHQPESTLPSFFSLSLHQQKNPQVPVSPPTPLILLPSPYALIWGRHSYRISELLERWLGFLTCKSYYKPCQDIQCETLYFSCVCLGVRTQTSARKSLPHWCFYYLPAHTAALEQRVGQRRVLLLPA